MTKISSLSYRLAVVEDADALVPTINLAYRGERSWTTEAHLVKNERITKDEFIKQVQSGHSPIFVALDNDDTTNQSPIGCIQIEHYDPVAHKYIHSQTPTSSVLLGLFAVHPDHQSKGVGKFLISTALDYTKQTLHIPSAYVWVLHVRNDIQKWYSRLGFADTGHKVDFVAPQNALVQDLHFQVWRRDL